ncbi:MULTISPECIES: DUF4136 domain-containing protein [Desulfosediminicola]|uniref:DUF4136 domain-containing protein n=1 Tax=Desulfosediminicola TaxID=2886823 RepID=UPI0010AD69DD|nr:DUF4136 domain-containing protein [Desulfosediminicola ganghwensis]
MKNMLVCCLAAFALLLGGCSTVRVNQDYKPGTNFSQYRSYHWQQPAASTSEDMRVQNPLLHERFQQAINAGLAGRGLFPGAPDFLVTYNYRIETRIQSEPYSTSVGYGYGRSYRYSGVAFGTGGMIRQYDVGILVIDFYDARTGALIWRGTGSEIVSSNPTPEKTTEFVNKMVSSILSQYPPI